MTFSTQQRSLIVSGAILFLLGLLQGVAIQSFANPRMALSAHLTAVQCGMATMIVGIIWPAVSLNAKLSNATRYGIPLGFYALWLGLSLSAVTGASQSLPIAGAGHRAGPQIETLISAIILGSSGLILLGWASLVWGLACARRQLS